MRMCWSAPGPAPAKARARTGACAPMRMTFSRALCSELRRLARSPLVAVHAACALAAGLACGAYFATAPWDARLGADAYVQFLGALMPLMAGISCGLSADEERRAGGLANLLGAPSRRAAVLAKLCSLWLAASATLAAAVALFGCVLAAAGRPPAPVVSLAASVLGMSLGSVPLYALSLFLALRLGRNAAIGVGAAGMLLAFFSVGGLAHGLMTGALAGASPAGLLGAVLFCWAARLGSLGVEAAIAAGTGSAGTVALAAARFVPAAAALAALSAVAIVAWFPQFEEGRSGA